MTDGFTEDADRPSFVRRALSGGFRTESIVTSATSVGLYVLGVVTGPLLARTLGASNRGRLAAVFTLTMLLGGVATGGYSLACAYLRDREDNHALLGNAFATTALLALPLVAGAWVVMPRVMHASGTPLLVARCFLLVLPVFGLATCWAEMVRARRAGPGWNALRAVPTVVNAALIVGLALAHRLTLSTALASQLAGTSAFVVICLVGVGRQRPMRLSRDVWRRQSSYARRVFVGFAADAVTNRLDQVVLAFAVAPAELGNYAVAVTLSSLSGSATSGLAIALYAHLLRSPFDPKAAEALKVTVVMSALIACAVGLGGYLLIPFVFGQDFQAARLALLLLLPGQVATDAVQVRFTQLQTMGRPGDVSRATVYASVLTVLGLLAFVPRFGIYAAAAVSSVAYLLRYWVAARAVRVGIPSRA
jgi:antigen flippase